MNSKYVKFQGWRSLSYSNFRIHEAVDEGYKHIIVRFRNDYGLSFIKDENYKESERWEVALIKFYGRYKYDFTVVFDHILLPWPVKGKTIEEGIELGYAVEEIEHLSEYPLIKSYFENR